MKSLRVLSIVAGSIALVVGVARAEPPAASGGKAAMVAGTVNAVPPPAVQKAPASGASSGDTPTTLPAVGSVPGVPQALAERVASPDFRRGPSLYETGRVGKMGVSEAGVQIDQTRTRTMPKELPIDNKSESKSESKLDSKREAAAGSHGLVNAAVLKREIRSHFALLTDCPSEVARNRRVRPKAIKASRLTLRWTILPAGTVVDTQVVATAPADGLVMNCVKREMSQWSFTPPEGGPVRVERPFKFRSSTVARR